MPSLSSFEAGAQQGNIGTYALPLFSTLGEVTLEHLEEYDPSLYNQVVPILNEVRSLIPQISKDDEYKVRNTKKTPHLQMGNFSGVARKISNKLVKEVDANPKAIRVAVKIALAEHFLIASA